MSFAIAVLLTCHNRRDNTLECLGAFYQALHTVGGLAKAEVYLVDDDSTDGTSQAVKQNYPDVKVILGDGNLFWNRGMIKAWEEARKDQPDFFLWLNDDTVLTPDALLTLLNDSAKYNHTSIISGVCKATESNDITYSGYLMSDKKRLRPAGEPVKCDYFNGNVVLIPYAVFEKVGMLDSVFHHSLGDIDYGLRAKKLGITSYISSKITGVCDRHPALPAWCNPKKPFAKRLRHFKTPLAKNPKEIFAFERRHSGLHLALFRSSIIYLRLLSPKLWVLIGKADI